MLSVPALFLMLCPLASFVLMAFYFLYDMKEPYAKALPSLSSILSQAAKKGLLKDGITEEGLAKILKEKIVACFQGRAVVLNENANIDNIHRSKRKCSSTAIVEDLVRDLKQKTVQEGEGEEMKETLLAKEDDKKRVLMALQQKCIAEVKPLLEEVEKAGSWTAYLEQAQEGSGYLCSNKFFICTNLLTGRGLDSLVTPILRRKGNQAADAVSAEELITALKTAADIGKD
mmetsp:Transcript_11040/g.15354  ORF Transcript_11040/g.15354 Transcript_11040/m.15354 type:complete len:230 (-) Transcript_11040:64-753(-)